MSPISMASVAGAQNISRSSVIIGHQVSGYNAMSSSASNDIYHVTYGSSRRYAPNGMPKWSKTLGSGVNSFYGMAMDSNGNIYSGGRSYGAIVKQDSDGNILWQKNTSTNSSIYSQSIVLDPSGNIYIAGQLDGYNSVPTQWAYATITKLDSNGNVLWSYITSQTGMTYSNNLCYDPVNNRVYVVAGNNNQSSPTSGNSGLNRTALLIALSSSGSILWQRFFSYSSNDFTTHGVATDSSGNVYVSGTWPTVPSIMKLDANGNLIWSTQLVGYPYYTFYVTMAVSDSYIYIHDYDKGLAKLDFNGNLIWQRWVTMNDSTLYNGALGISISGDGQAIVGNSNNYAIRAKIDGSGSGIYDWGSYAPGVWSTSSIGVSISTSGWSWSSAGFSSTNSAYTLTVNSIPSVKLNYIYK